MGKVSQQRLRELWQYVQYGYIRVAKHPTLPLSIYNYTQTTQTQGFWDEMTMACRGLVLDDDGRVVIECPRKFFNHIEPQAPNIDLKKAVISAKLDGYYISVKDDSEYGLIVTSRGSFDNQYVEAARKLLDGKKLEKDVSYFFELCQNFPRDEGIIVAKHPIPRLVLWGERDQNGWVLDLKKKHPDWDVADVFTYDEAVEYLDNKVEWVVAMNPETFSRVKIKTAWFLERHRLISNCTKKRVFEINKNGLKVADLDIPDELMPQMKKWEDELISQFMLEAVCFEELWEKYKGYDKKSIALDEDITDYEKPLLFCKHDGKDAKIVELLWKRVAEKCLTQN